MSLIHVQAVSGRLVPREGLPTEMIGETPVAVVESHYYRSHIADGALRVVDPADAPAPKPVAAPVAPDLDDAETQHDAEVEG